EVVGRVGEEGRDLVEQGRRHQLAAFPIADRCGTIGVQRLEVAGVLPVVASVVLATLGGRADVPDGRVHEELEAPAVLDSPACAWADRLPRGPASPGAR